MGEDGSYIVFSMRQKAAQLLPYKSPASARLKIQKSDFVELEE